MLASSRSRSPSTRLRWRALIALLGSAACAAGTGAQSRRALGEEILESGGELALAALPAQTISRARGEVTAWGLVEVPGDSRLQAAFAIADANARAELIASVQVGIASSLSVGATSANAGAGAAAESEEAREATAQVAHGVLPALPAPRHGWQRVRRDGVVLLRVCAELTAREELLLRAFEQASSRARDPAAQARDELAKLGAGHALGAD